MNPIPQNARPHRRHRLSHFAWEVCIGATVGIVVLLLVYHGPLETWELAWMDAILSVQAERPSSDVKLVVATAEDFAAWGGPRLPEYFPRDMLAALIERIADMRPAAILVDVLVSEHAAAHDRDLREAIASATRHDVSVIIARDPSKPEAGSFTPPALAGAVDLRLGPQHEVRWLYPESHVGATNIKSMSVLAVESYRRRRLAVGLPPGPTPPEEPIPIRFWPRDEFASYPAHLVLNQDASAMPPEWVRNSIVIIGRQDAASQDVWYVPVQHSPVPGPRGDQMYGMEVQANCLATVLSPSSPRLGRFWQGVAVEVLVAAAASLAVMYLGLLWGSLIALATVMLLGSYVSLQLFHTTGHVLNVLPTLLAVTLTSIVGRSLEQRRLRSWLGAMVGTPVAAALGRQLLPEPGVGAVEDVVILNFDLRQSSQLALEMNPAEFGSKVNEMMAQVCTCVLDHGGIVNKYLGDGLLAFWPAAGCPDRHSARDALAAARAIHDRLAGLAPSWRGSAGRELRFAIALHCGPAWLGFVGVPHRIEYTALGSTVSDCFRLQEIAARSGAEMIVSKSLLDAAPDGADSMPVEGKWQQGQQGDLTYHAWSQQTEGSGCPVFRGRAL